LRIRLTVQSPHGAGIKDGGGLLRNAASIAPPGGLAAAILAAGRMLPPSLSARQAECRARWRPGKLSTVPSRRGAERLPLAQRHPRPVGRPTVVGLPPGGAARVTPVEP